MFFCPETWWNLAQPNRLVNHVAFCKTKYIIVCFYVLRCSIVIKKTFDYKPTRPISAWRAFGCTFRDQAAFSCFVNNSNNLKWLSPIYYLLAVIPPGSADLCVLSHVQRVRQRRTKCSCSFHINVHIHSRWSSLPPGSLYSHIIESIREIKRWEMFLNIFSCSLSVVIVSEARERSFLRAELLCCKS